MAPTLERLLELTRRLSHARLLAHTLQAVVDCGVELAQAPRVSVRLLDPTHARLIAVCRAGKPMHHNATTTYDVGQGLLGWIAKHGVPLRSPDAMADPRFVGRPDMVEPMGSYLGVPIVIEHQTIGVLSAVSPEKAAFTEEHEQLFTLAAGIAAPYVEVGRLSRLAQVDALTGALNRHGLDAFRPAAEHAGLLSVVMADVDHFKALNDTLGHAAGDTALRQVSQLLATVTRESDALVRYGGEEFLLLLANADLTQARRIAERARETVAATPIAGRAVTLSAGVAQRRAGEALEAAIARADAALFSAKRDGRNRVASAE